MFWLTEEKYPFYVPMSPSFQESLHSYNMNRWKVKAMHCLTILTEISAHISKMAINRLQAQRMWDQFYGRMPIIQINI